MNIVLIGARGSGKSAAALQLGQRLGRRVFSTDAEVERREGRSIREIVATYGWQRFRDIESQVIMELEDQRDLIVDAGGGVVLRSENVERLRAHGIVVWLQADVATLASRIQEDTNRPPLTGMKSHVDEVAEVLAERLPLYKAAAHHVVDTSDRPVEQVVDEIIRIVDVEKPKRFRRASKRNPMSK